MRSYRKSGRAFTSYAGLVLKDAERHVFQSGDRVKLNDVGLARHPRITNIGTVIKSGGPSSWLIIFDGRSTPQNIHYSYLEEA